MPIIPSDPITDDFHYDKLFQSMNLTVLQRLLDAVVANGVGGGEFNNKLLQVDTIGNTHYIGYANAGSVTSATVWAIKRVVETGNNVVITWADGTKDFDNVWDKPTSINYIP